MYCRKCGKQSVHEGARFCSRCGFPLDVNNSYLQNENMGNNNPSMVPRGQTANIPVCPTIDTPRKNGSKEKKKKKFGWKKILAAAIAALIAIEVIHIRPWEGVKPPVVPPVEPVIDDPIEVNALTKEYLDYFGVTKEDIEEYEKISPQITPDSSPYNPSLLEVGFSKEEYESAYTISQEISRENPEADFDEFGIHINVKSWNLDNETDTLIVKRLPDKKDEVFGTELYSYDFSLASGQHKFYTDVEISIPLQGASDGMVNALYLNEDTGKWETLYYEVAEDGNSYTVFMDHFSTESGQKDLSLESIKKMEKEMQQYSSIFYIRNFYYDTNTGEKVAYSDPKVMPLYIDFTKLNGYILKNRNDVRVLYRELNATGGIPAEAAFQETITSWGISGDIASTTLTAVTLFFKSFSAKYSVPLNVAGYFLTQTGAFLYYLRMSDQMERGVDAKEIADSNFWGKASLIASGVGMIAGMLSAPAAGFISVGCAVTCSVIFVGTLYSSISQSIYDKNHPLGIPTSPEEGAYHYHLMKGYAGLDIHGGGWAEALRNAFDKYRNDPVKLESQIEKYYETFIAGSWDKKSDEYKALCLYEYAYEYACDALTASGNSYKKLQIEDDKLEKIVNDVLQLSYPYDSIEEGVLPSKFLDHDIWMHAYEVRKDNIADYFGVDFSSEKMKDYQEKARKVLYKNTNQIVYEFFKTELHKAKKDIIDHIYDHVLPILNSTVTFYAKDTSLEEPYDIIESPYYRFLVHKGHYVSFRFSNYSQILHFDDPNDTVENLPLIPQDDGDELLVISLWQYLKFGCPEGVSLEVDKTVEKGNFPDLESTTGTVNWNGIEVLSPNNETGVARYRVPIEFRSEERDPKHAVKETETVKSYKMRTVFDHMIGFSENFQPDMYKGIRMPEDVMCNVSSNGRVEISIPELSQEFTAADTSPPNWNLFYKKRHERTPISIVAQLSDTEYYDHKKYGKVTEATSKIYGFSCYEETRSAKDGLPSYLDHYSYEYSENQINQVYVQGSEGVSDFETSRITLEYDENNNLKSVSLELCCEYMFCSSSTEEVEGQKKWETIDRYWRYLTFAVAD